MKVVIHPAYRHLTSFVYGLPCSFDSEGTLLYQGRNAVKRYQTNGTDLVVKRYKRPNFIQRLVYAYFKRSKTARAYDYAALLREKGIDTPHEVAYIETFEKGLFATGYFVSLYCSDPPVSVQLDVEEFNLKFSNPLTGNVAATFPAGQVKEFNYSLADSLAAFFVELHAKGILHGDLNLSNILYHQEEDGKYHFCVIDTNRSVFKNPTPDECLENLKRVTHRRDVLIYLVSRYAELRGWSSQKCTGQIMRQLDRFEKKNSLKLKFKHWLGLKYR